MLLHSWWDNELLWVKVTWRHLLELWRHHLIIILFGEVVDVTIIVIIVVLVVIGWKTVIESKLLITSWISVHGMSQWLVRIYLIISHSS